MSDFDQTQRELHQNSSEQPAPTDLADGRLDRRTFLKQSALAGGGLLAGAIGASALTGALGGSRAASSAARAIPAARSYQQPNILVILVDQLRSNPRWISAMPVSPSLLPNVTRLGGEGVSFANHYTASNDCTPARSTLLTGLYTHQTGCMITGGSTLDPGFPTWGRMLREHGYRTYWYGKWHLTHGDNKWSILENADALEPYGFSGGTYPSPDGAPGQGWRVDPLIVSQFGEWFEQVSAQQPWCTTVSLVNPHDIAWWYTWTKAVKQERSASRTAQQMPLNFETPEQLQARRKPRLQLSLQQTAAQAFGEVPFSGSHATKAWLSMMDLYAKLQQEVDRHVGAVLQTLQSRPDVAQNTIVIFSSDHGEYAGSHGLRGKGAAAYEEGIRVPLIIRDPRGVLTKPGQVRDQLTSSVDVAPLLLSIANGSEEWRRDSHYEHIADRLELMRVLRDPSAPGRSHVLHATDEVVTEFALEPYAGAPAHVLALRTPRAKLVTYCDWRPGTVEPVVSPQDSELYDYRTRAGRLELRNSIGESPLEESMRATLAKLYKDELARPLPRHLANTRRAGLADYFSTAARDAKGAAAARMRQAAHAHRISPPGRTETNQFSWPA
ncbi:MAG TPA: sulfatase-like hydrolase/transferase [Solirubrobacteraceae bacterium]|jgi:arylsulfatase A-like enzyme